LRLVWRSEPTARITEIGAGLIKLHSMLNWATRANDGDVGETLLERNPLLGLKIPRERSPCAR